MHAQAGRGRPVVADEVSENMRPAVARVVESNTSVTAELHRDEVGNRLGGREVQVRRLGRSAVPRDHDQVPGPGRLRHRDVEADGGRFGWYVGRPYGEP